MNFKTLFNRLFYLFASKNMPSQYINHPTKPLLNDKVASTPCYLWLVEVVPIFIIEGNTVKLPRLQIASRKEDSNLLDLDCQPIPSIPMISMPMTESEFPHW